MRSLRVSLLPVLAVATVFLAGCGGSHNGGSNDGGAGATPSPTTTASSATGGMTLTPITITRTGGFAGVNQAIAIAADGRWTYTDHRANKTETGTLSDLQRTQLAALIGAPGLAQESRQSPGGLCADGFRYEVTVGDLRVAFEDCGRSDRPALTALLDAITRATPL